MTRPDDERAWKPVGADRLALDSFVRVLQRTFRLPDGQEAVWDLLDVPPSVAVLPMTPERRVVCVRQYRPGPGRVVLSIPGGLVDEGESVAEAAARELREETGYATADVEVVTSTMANNGTHPRSTAVARNCFPAHPQALDPNGYR